MEEEIWKQVAIEGCELYEVSNKGDVRNSKTKRILKPSQRGGYPAIRMNRKSYSNHIVAQLTFNGEREKRMIINHKDGNRDNPITNNLEYTTISENAKHAIRTGLNVHPTVRVDQYTLEDEYIQTFNSVKEAAEKTGASSKHIPSVCTGKRKTAGGFIWKYTDKKELHNSLKGKEIEGFPNYVVTKDGRVFNIKTNREMARTIDNKGYHKVTLSNNGFVKTFQIHRLVALAYIKMIQDKDIVNHIDKNKLNNNVSNLEWTDFEGNMLHHALTGKKAVVAVSQFSIDDEWLCDFVSVKEAAENTGVDNSSIVKSCKGKVNHAGGFIWKYKL